VRVRPAPVVVVDGATRLTAVALDDAVARLAGGLRTAGVRGGEVVTWQLPNRWEAVALYQACWRLGAVAAPVHHLAGTAEVEAAHAAVDPRVVVEADHLPRLLTGDPVRHGDGRGSDVAAALFTSGSSGTAKAVLHTQQALFDKARLMASVHGLTSDDAVLIPAPLAHISGLLNAVLVPHAARMTAVLQRRWDPDEAAAAIESERVTAMFGPPTFFLGLREASVPPRSLRLVSCGGTGVTPEFIDSTSEALGCVVKRTYGSTEAPTVTTAHAGDPREKARATDGRPTGAVELRLDGDSGELLVRGPEVFVGYTDAALTAAAFAPDRWFRTGDLGTIDDDGWLTITGRLKDLIIRGGENVATSEVEAACESHPAVREAVAVGEPDERLGERVAVFVVLAPGADGFDVKTPERVVVVDALPLLAAGKPDRRALRDRLAG